MRVSAESNGRIKGRGRGLQNVGRNSALTIENQCRQSLPLIHRICATNFK
jgi:hypothetical protein